LVHPFDIVQLLIVETKVKIILIELKCLKLCASSLKLFEQNHLWQRAQVFLTVQSQSFHPRPPLGPFSSTQFSGDSNLLGSPSKIKSIS
jgi:hypothetical protein